MLVAWLITLVSLAPSLFAADANRLTYVDSAEPFHVGAHFPKLTTPQWVGDTNVEVVVTLGIDDMRESARYEAFLRPILDRLKRIDGRAPVSIFCNSVAPDDPQLQTWLKEGLSLEVHTLSHPCPILSRHDFAAAQNTFHGGVDLLNHVAGNVPVAFRTPCCDSINSPSPRVYAELFAHTNAAGQFLRMDSSVVMLLTTNDPMLPRDLVMDADGRGRFSKYVPFPSFVTTVENYPYPWVIGNLCWEFACMAPSDWEAQNILGKTNATMLADWQAALDAVAVKQGTFNFVFHPHGWSANGQFVDFIDYATTKHGSRVKFLNYREASDRLTANLGAGQPLRAADGGDNGVRLVDLNNDGFLDVVIGNDAMRRTRIWQPEVRQWLDSVFPVELVSRSSEAVRETGARFGILHSDGRVSLLLRNEHMAGVWTFDGSNWIAQPNLLRGLELDGQPVLTSREGRDRGVRFRDAEGDGVCELLVGNESQNAVFRWSEADQTWKRAGYALPPDTSIVNAAGQDNGLRFADVNEDGHDDVIFSNEERFGVWLFVPEPVLNWSQGWTRKAMAGRRREVATATPSAEASAAGTPIDEVPPIVRAGPHRNNGAWFHSRHLWVQNENTAHLPNLVERRSFDDLVRGVIDPPKSPAEALAAFRVRPGFTVELVAAEPLVRDPVAFDWGADGRVWVAEMRDYPMGMDGQGKPGGAIKVLEDTDGDGHYDKATEFLHAVPFPSGVMAWRNGVLVSSAPEIFYAEDTDGDGRADRHEVLFTGFKEGNQQHRVNGFAWGLDGWIYGANGDSGGSIVRSDAMFARWKASRGASALQLTNAPISISGRDFRFRPDTGEFEAIEGQTQFGRVRDDWGNWFGNANYTWLWHYPLPARYLARNPHLAVRDLRQMLAQYEGGNHLFPISRAQPRPNAVGAENTVTSACGSAPYRDDLFGPGFATSIFISEPTENVIHREVLEESGSGFTSRRAAGEEASEFLASTDNWFRPTQLKTGPDGALYVADMYRLSIEHPEWIPPDLQRRFDVRAGSDLGRIWRIALTNTPRRAVPRLDKLDTAGLVAALNSPNGWQRDTAMRLLFERNDPKSVRLLKRLAAQARDPKARLQALATLDALNLSDSATLRTALRDRHPAVRAEALRASEPLLREKKGGRSLASAVLKLKADPNAHVALQLAFTLGELRDTRAGTALVTLAERAIPPAGPTDERLLIAVQSSALPHLEPMLTALAKSERPPAPLLSGLLNFAAATGNDAALAQGVTATLKLDQAGEFGTQLSALASLLDALDRRNDRRRRDEMLAPFAPVFARARETGVNPTANEAVRLAALKIVGRGGAESTVAPARLVELLSPTQSIAVQQAALRALGYSTDATAANALLAQWPTLGPQIRPAALELVLTKPVWTQRLLAAVEAGAVAPREFSPALRQKLLERADSELRTRAGKLFAATRSDREVVLSEFANATERRGEPRRGHDIFLVNCAPCHRLQGEGSDVGPDLGAILDKSAEALLIAILDPNRAVEERYVAYTAHAKAGREFAGIVVSESPNSVTLRNTGGAEEVFLRNELTSLTSLRRSLMPEGFETSMDAPAMADLIAYLTASGPKPKEFSGNRPAAVSPDQFGALRLTARDAEIYGDSLVFEAGYGNLGFWQSENDRAVWTIELPRAGRYDVWLDHAAPWIPTPNRLRLEAGENRLETTIPSTGSWDTYRQTRLGTLTLAAGRTRIAVLGLAPLHGAILDLRELRLMPEGAAAPADFTTTVVPTK
jgi:putative membrane-bound dehydrogenase-like protein